MNHQSATAVRPDNQTQIGLEKEKSTDLAKKLNTLLANYSVFYQNTRGYHWNLKGNKFFELHLKFEELYLGLNTKIDELAERIATLGFVANHNFSVYSRESKVVENTNVKDGMIAVEDILNSFRIILAQQREILEFADEMGDEGTYTLMSDTIKEQEKIVWMYTAYLGK